MAFIKTREVKGVPGLSVIKLPLYVPTVVLDTLSGMSNSLSFEKLSSVVNENHASEPISDTLFDSLRETNAIPSPSQAQALRSIRATCEADLESLDAEIQRLHSKISDLSLTLTEITIRHVQRQKLSSTCSSWLSSLRRIPPEILGEIFIRCLPWHGRPVATAAPLLLTHVCSAWRKTALGFPLLWNHLFLRTAPGIDQATSYLNMFNIMELWFNRANGSPLTFHLYNDYGSNREYYGNFLITMIKHAGRFRKLHISSTSVNDIHGFVTQMPGRLVLLESLQLEIGDLDISHLKIRVFNKAPHLREVILNVEAPNFIHQLILPWKQLTNISVIGTAIYQLDLLYMLRECEQLVSGSFAITTAEGDGNIAHIFGADPIVLEYLVDLKVSLSLPGNFESQFIALDKLSLPTLTHFSLVGDCEENTRRSYIPLLGVLRSAPRLQHFTLLDFFTTHDDLLPILRSTPRLTFLKLALNPESEYNPLIEALRYVDGQSGTYVPLLEYLDIRVESAFDGLDVNELMLMVRSRRISRVDVPRPPVAYLNLHLRLCEDLLLVARGPLPELNILNSARETGEIEISAYNSDDDDDDNSISLDLS